MTDKGAMSCRYAELAHKIEVHQKLDVPGVGYILTEMDIQTIIEALLYTSIVKQQSKQRITPQQKPE